MIPDSVPSWTDMSHHVQTNPDGNKSSFACGQTSQQTGTFLWHNQNSSAGRGACRQENNTGEESNNYWRLSVASIGTNVVGRESDSKPWKRFKIGSTTLLFVSRILVVSCVQIRDCGIRKRPWNSVLNLFEFFSYSALTSNSNRSLSVSPKTLFSLS